ncbi:MAG: tetratricopeptide repeat protein [Candidatus Poribacteria bacterium]|nr:tetratricopeptide repeat protein [Candidatus Poribacteria bacterium]
MQNGFNFRQLLIGFILILWTGVVYGQQYASIYLKNGDHLRGRWLGADEKSAHIEIYNQRLSIPLSDVKNIVPFEDVDLIPDAAAEKHFRHGEAFLQLEMREEAKDRFLAAIAAFPKYAEAHYQLGLLFQEEGNNDEAIRYFGHVAKINAEGYNMAAQFRQAGDTYFAAEEYRKAVDAYLLVFRHYSDHPNAEFAAYTAGFLLTEELDAAKEGLSTLQEAVAQFPDSMHLERASYLMGVLQSKVGQAAIAVDTLTKFILNYPESEWLIATHLARGDAFLQLRQNQDAFTDYSYAYENTPNLKMKREAQKKRDESAWTIYKVSDGLPSNQIQAVAVDGETLWIGTAKGLAQIDISMGSWQPMTNITEFINTTFDETDPIHVKALDVDEQELWIGTLNHGVIRYNKLTQISEAYNTRNGLPHKTVYDIKIDGDEVWIGTFSGVARYHRLTGKWTTYNREEDYLPADDIVALAVAPTTVWIGTSASGIAAYDRELDYWRDFEPEELRPGSSIVNFDVVGNQVFFTWYYKDSSDSNDDRSGFAIVAPNEFKEFKSRVEEVISGTLVPVENIYVAVGRATEETAESAPLVLATNDGLYIQKQPGGWDLIEAPADWFGVPTLTCIALGEGFAWVGSSNGLAKINMTASALQPE